jgi:hypothetical protein
MNKPMKTIQTIFSAMIILVILVAVSCEPDEKIGIIPEISFKSLNGPFLIETGTITSYGAELIFKFRDGDSDFGVDMSSHPEDTINLFMIPFQKINGVYDSIDTELYGRRYTIKRDEKLDKAGGAVKGEIKVLVTYVLRPPFDTMRFDFYILDRAGNQSNVESSSDISF